MPRSSLPTALRSSIARIAEAASSREYTEPSGGSIAPGSISGMRSRHCWPTNPGLMCQNSFEAAPMTVVLVSSSRSALTVGISRPVKPMTMKRPSVASERSESVKRSPPTGSTTMSAPRPRSTGGPRRGSRRSVGPRARPRLGRHPPRPGWTGRRGLARRDRRPAGSQPSPHRRRHRAPEPSRPRPVGRGGAGRSQRSGSSTGSPPPCRRARHQEREDHAGVDGDRLREATGDGHGGHPVAGSHEATRTVPLPHCGDGGWDAPTSRCPSPPSDTGS